MERKLRPLRMVSSIASLLVALFSIERTYELVMDWLLPLMRYGNEFTPYGWGVIAAIALRVAITGALFWAFVRLGSSKPATLVVGKVAALGIVAGRAGSATRLAVSPGRPPATRRSHP